MAKKLVSDELWTVIEPLLPAEGPSPKGGRPRIPNRAVLAGILFVLSTGIPWEQLPREMGCGSGMTCWRRLRDWHKAGIWDRLHRTLLERLSQADQLDWSRASIDPGSVPAPGRGEATGPNPTDRRKSGSKRHLVVERQGIPLVIRHIGAHVNKTTLLEEMVDAIPAIRQKRGRPRRRPAKLDADKGYDSLKNRQVLRQRHILPRIARRRIESSQKLGRHRWVVERTLAGSIAFAA